MFLNARLTNENSCSAVFNFDGKQSPGLPIKFSLYLGQGVSALEALAADFLRRLIDRELINAQK